MTRRAEVDTAAEVLGTLDWLRALLDGGVTLATVPADVWAAVLGALDLAETLPDLGPLIAALGLSDLITPLSVAQTSIDPATLTASIDIARARIEAWVNTSDADGERTAELRRRQAQELVALRARAAATTGPHTAQVRLVLRCKPRDLSPGSFNRISEEVEVALRSSGEYVGHDYDTRGTLQIYLLGPNLSAMMDAVLPAVEPFVGPGSFYESRHPDDPADAPSVRVEL